MITEQWDHLLPSKITQHLNKSILTKFYFKMTCLLMLFLPGVILVKLLSSINCQFDTKMSWKQKHDTFSKQGYNKLTGIIPKVKCMPRKITNLTACLVILFILRLNVPVNNFSVMSGRSQRFLGLTSTVES